MALVNIIMPKLGESIMEATVLKWHKQVGDTVALDETLLDIATDKVDSEVPSTSEGILEEILCQENDVISIGSVIARIRDNAEESVPTLIPTKQPTSQAIKNKIEESTDLGLIGVPYQPSGYTNDNQRDTDRFYSPLVMKIASTEGISLSELEKIKGSGNQGRVTKKDILDYLDYNIRNGNTGGLSNQYQGELQRPSNGFLNGNVSAQEFPIPENVEIIEMDRMRKLIADHMTNSLRTSAHVTSFAEADVTNLVLWREKNKKQFEKREGEKITFTPLFIEAIVKCIKNFPILNASVVNDKIIIKKDINIGMATALPNGNLIVPVIKNADQLNIIGLVKQVNRLAGNARNGKLHPSDTKDGTFTFTNIGTFGSLMGTPIINQPQVAIIATGAIKKKPIVIETEQGDSIAIRHMMFVSISYDHRIIDGGMGSRFLEAFVKTLEAFPQDMPL
jgi:2-oxoglutarate dehydrogenase E2 component (dihydrolipoamide succinyltransferase)